MQIGALCFCSLLEFLGGVVLYSVSILSPSTPSFVSAEDKIYVEDAAVPEFCEFRRDVLSDLGISSDWMCDVLFGGTTSFDSKVRCSVPVVARKSVRVGDVSYEYVNVWDCMYSFEFRGVTLAFAWIDDDGCFRRITKLHADELFLDDKPVRFAMGEPGVVRFSDDGVSSMAYLCDVVFPTRDDMFADVADPCLDMGTSHVIEMFLGHVVADG